MLPTTDRPTDGNKTQTGQENLSLGFCNLILVEETVSLLAVAKWGCVRFSLAL